MTSRETVAGAVRGMPSKYFKGCEMENVFLPRGEEFTFYPTPLGTYRIHTPPSPAQLPHPAIQHQRKAILGPRSDVNRSLSQRLPA